MIDEKKLINEIEKSMNDNTHTDKKIRMNHITEHQHFIDMVNRQPKIVEQIPSTMLQTGFYDRNGNLIEVGDTVRLILDDGEERIFDVRFKTVQRVVKCHPDFVEENVKVVITGIVFCWEGYELFPCVDEKGVVDTSKMEIIKKGGGIDPDPGSLIEKNVIGEVEKV